MEKYRWQLTVVGVVPPDIRITLGYNFDEGKDVCDMCQVVCTEDCVDAI